MLPIRRCKLCLQLLTPYPCLQLLTTYSTMTTVIEYVHEFEPSLFWQQPPTTRLYCEHLYDIVSATNLIALNSISYAAKE